MNSAWHWFITVFTILNILACLWLIAWSSKHGDQKKAAMDTLDHVWDEDLQERNNPLPRWWLFLFVGTIIWGLGYLAWYPGLGAFSGVGKWTQIQQYEEERDRVNAVYEEKFSKLAAMSSSDLSRNSDAMDIGGRLFGSNCATCHGADARGATGFPNLTDNDWLYGASADTIHYSISNGRNGVMPPWGTVLGDDGVKEVIEYVKSLSGLKFAKGLAEGGKPRYEMLCISCHGNAGQGMQALGSPALNDSVWLYGSSNEALRDSIANGRANNMPAHKELLSPEEIKILTAYVLSLQHDRQDTTGH